MLGDLPVKRYQATIRTPLPFYPSVSVEITGLPSNSESYLHLKSLLSLMPKRLIGKHEHGDSRPEVTDFYYNLYCQMMDVEFNVWVDEYKPLTHLLHKYSHVAEPLKITDLMKQKNLLAYSGGKESVLANDMFQQLGLSMHHVRIHDMCQMSDPGQDIDDGAPIVIRTHLDPLYGLSGVKPIYPMFVAIQRLLILYWAETKGYDNVFFGDEKERQDLYWVTQHGKRFLYPSHDYFQTQNFYNVLAQHFGIKAKAYSATCMFTQRAIVEILSKKGIKHYCSCSRTAPRWCNNCDKCERISSLCKTANVTRPDGLWDIAKALTESGARSARSMLGLYDGKYDSTKYFIRPLDTKIETDAPYSPWSIEASEQIRDLYSNYL